IGNAGFRVRERHPQTPRQLYQRSTITTANPMIATVTATQAQRWDSLGGSGMGSNWWRRVMVVVGIWSWSLPGLGRERTMEAVVRFLVFLFLCTEVVLRTRWVVALARASVAEPGRRYFGGG